MSGCSVEAQLRFWSEHFAPETKLNNDALDFSGANVVSAMVVDLGCFCRSVAGQDAGLAQLSAGFAKKGDAGGSNSTTTG